MIIKVHLKSLWFPRINSIIFLWIMNFYLNKLSTLLRFEFPTWFHTWETKKNCIFPNVTDVCLSLNPAHFEVVFLNTDQMCYTHLMFSLSFFIDCSDTFVILTEDLDYLFRTCEATYKGYDILWLKEYQKEDFMTAVTTSRV